MLIRSQDKSYIANINKGFVHIRETYDTQNTCVIEFVEFEKYKENDYMNVLGVYASKQAAIKVMDSMLHAYEAGQKVFEMPEAEAVL